MLVTDAARLAKTDSSDARRRTVIIGSGAVGLFLAAELIGKNDGREVVVIEAGERHLGNFDSDSFRCVGLPSDGLKVGRSRSLGGTTNLWGGQLVEFQPVDFAGRAWMPDSKWPVAYDEIAPYYARAYESLGIDAEKQRDELVWKSVGAEPPRIGRRADGTASDIEPFLTRWLKTPNFAVYYERLIESEPRLKVLTGHAAVGFVRGEARRGGAGSEASIGAVRIRGRGGERTIAGDDFVLAAGTVENARLLLHAAADGSWECPWQGNDNVGRFYADHYGGPVAVVKPNDTKEFFNAFCTIAKSGHKYQPKIRLRNEVLERERLLNIHACFAFESSASEHLVYLKQFLKAALYSRKISGIGDVIRNSVSSVRYLVPLMWRYAWDHRIFVPSTSKITLNIQGEQTPCAESRVKIDPGARDANGLPRVVLDWRLAGGENAGDELKSILAFARRVEHALTETGLARMEIDGDLAALRPEFMMRMKDTIHQSGGAVMGSSAKEGVVDRDLRVFGTSNLYIGGSSTFRTVSNANITFTALAFAVRLGDHLAGERE